MPEQKSFNHILLFLIILTATASFSCHKGEKAMIKAGNINLPETINGWNLEGHPQSITRETIFDYMDGGGELYLAYKFQQLLVYKYLDGTGNELLVEIYKMQNPDEAFGLLSLDWSGEPVILNPEVQPSTEKPVCPSHTALYGEGLLRARIDNLYLRVLALNENPEVKETILRLGKSLAASASAVTFPEILDVIRPESNSPWQVRKERTTYFHSHLILNSLFYLSHENILNLNQNCEALYTEWMTSQNGIKKTSKMIIIQYPDSHKSRLALESFKKSFLSGTTGPSESSEKLNTEQVIRLEDGWSGWKISNNHLVLVFGAPDEESVRMLFTLVNL